MDDIIDVPKGIYKHFKGNMYEVLYTARDSESLEYMVVYKALYGEGGIWVRNARMFLEQINKDGKTYSRFERVD